MSSPARRVRRDVDPRWLAAWGVPGRSLEVRGDKRLAMVAEAHNRGFDPAECDAYSDSERDLPMLETVGHP